MDWNSGCTVARLPVLLFMLTTHFKQSSLMEIAHCRLQIRAPTNSQLGYPQCCSRRISKCRGMTFAWFFSGCVYIYSLFLSTILRGSWSGIDTAACILTLFGYVRKNHLFRVRRSECKAKGLHHCARRAAASPWLYDLAVDMDQITNMRN